ncbi:MAG: Biotin carboxyl carrier protein of acetyl-CoA carboxylase [Chlamydiia bacterium]|nr:Biotin carboxyl carrier protein of acetyl-CoA carboxylase [Chlamydiia bacterium]MCH9615176.1 Biotin carboxyl carrier protein of acetyl-CoA carboxylase [Chlamydiia bacterium]MCH9628502.1 Biotin carboxyl carrier protein of acetyl-CoA carboxylase [Chlamydiia bacterium]
MDAMEEKQLTKLSLKRGDNELVLEKAAPPVHASPALAPPPPVLSHAAAPAEAVQEAPAPEGEYITSPMVGSFYGSPAPDEPSFVKEGDRVSADTVVCIIEAMKVMNEVKAGQEGVIRRVLVESGNPVEYGTKLFEIQ